MPIAWLAPLALSHASLTLSRYLCTLPTAIAIAGQLPPTLPAAVMSAPPTILRRLHDGRVPSLPLTTCLGKGSIKEKEIKQKKVLGGGLLADCFL